MARRITCYKLIFQHKQEVSRSAALSWIIKLVYGTNNHMPTLLNSSLPPSLNLSTLGNEDSPIGDSSGEVATCLCFSHMTWDVPVLSDLKTRNELSILLCFFAQGMLNIRTLLLDCVGLFCEVYLWVFLWLFLWVCCSAFCMHFSLPERQLYRTCKDRVEDDWVVSYK